MLGIAGEVEAASVATNERWRAHRGASPFDAGLTNATGNATAAAVGGVCLQTQTSPVAFGLARRAAALATDDGADWNDVGASRARAFDDGRATREPVAQNLLPFIAVQGRQAHVAAAESNDFFALKTRRHAAAPLRSQDRPTPPERSQLVRSQPLRLCVIRCEAEVKIQPSGGTQTVYTLNAGCMTEATVAAGLVDERLASVGRFAFRVI